MICFSEIGIHTIPSDKEAFVAHAVDMLTDYVGFVWCVVQIFAFVVNDVLDAFWSWQKYIDHINERTKYFRYHV